MLGIVTFIFARGLGEVNKVAVEQGSLINIEKLEVAVTESTVAVSV